MYDVVIRLFFQIFTLFSRQSATWQTNNQTRNRKWGKTETLPLLELYKKLYADLQCTTKHNDVM